MKKLSIILSLVIVISLLISFDNKSDSAAFPPWDNDSLAQERRRYMEMVMSKVGDRKMERADSVFKNVITFSGDRTITADHFVRLMNYWGRALGISCTHCHNTNDWASDEKKAKQTARGMFELRQIINRQISLEINGLESIKPVVNCGTCHKGKVIPEE